MADRSGTHTLGIIADGVGWAVREAKYGCLEVTVSSWLEIGLASFSVLLLPQASSELMYQSSGQMLLRAVY